MRVAVFWTRLSGYLNACLGELASRPGVELLVAHQEAGEDAPFDESQFSWMSARLNYGSRPDREELLAQTRRFAPDVLLVGSWHIGQFRFVLERLQPRPLRVLCMDNQWHGTWKQRLGVVGSPWYIRRLYDAAFLPGERQACFARRLGFPDDRIWQGLLCPAAATSVPEEVPRSPLPRAFGYLGRLSPEKGIQDLLEAYRIYSASTRDPWKLHIAGAGPLKVLLDGYPSVQYSGFVQPSEVTGWMKDLGSLIVPSRFDPWGVVISEGASAGLLIIATDDFANGRVARTGDVRSIAECMAFLSSLSDDKRLAMGRVSRGLASPYTPVRWADTVLRRSAELIQDRVPR
jgi:glycosyltransferase involved in cell wall biosynthesis